VIYSVCRLFKLPDEAEEKYEIPQLDSYCRSVISIRILGNKFVVYSKTVICDYLERKLRFTENVVDKEGTIIYLSEYFHFPSQCLSTNAPHSHSLTYHRRCILIIGNDSVA